MKKVFLIFVIIISCCNTIFSQLFTGDDIAIHKDSSIIISWAVSATVERGYINIADTSQYYTERGITSNKAFHGSVDNVTGKADGTFLSLGDGGSIVLRFDKPITNGPGPDFVVFENAIFTPPFQTDSSFVELAFVEVSSDGINYERFPASTNVHYEQQISTYRPLDWKAFKNFAGIYPVFYGVPFDLDDIPGEQVDKSRITHVRIVDVVGNIDPEYATYDSQGYIVNDPWPTPFATCGFDLDAVGVIHECSLNVNSLSSVRVFVYPNPAKDFIKIETENLENIRMFDLGGRLLLDIEISQDQYYLNVEELKSGIYMLILNCTEGSYSQKIVISD